MKTRKPPAPGSSRFEAVGGEWTGQGMARGDIMGKCAIDNNEIRQLYDKGMKVQDIAKIAKVGRDKIYEILRSDGCLRPKYEFNQQGAIA